MLETVLRHYATSPWVSSSGILRLFYILAGLDSADFDFRVFE